MFLNDSFQQPARSRDAVAAPSGSVADSLLGLVESSDQISAPVEINHCPACGYTREELGRTGRFGCAQCYVTFSDVLPGTLKAAQGGATQHVGKVPAPPKPSGGQLEGIEHNAIPFT